MKITGRLHLQPTRVQMGKKKGEIYALLWRMLRSGYLRDSMNYGSCCHIYSTRIWRASSFSREQCKRLSSTTDAKINMQPYRTITALTNRLEASSSKESSPSCGNSHAYWNVGNHFWQILSKPSCCPLRPQSILLQHGSSVSLRCTHVSEKAATLLSVCDNAKLSVYPWRITTINAWP